VVRQATWRGRYQKNFTYHALLGVNLGKLESGKYAARAIIEPLTFTTFEGADPTKRIWPKDDRAAAAKPVDLTATFQCE
jgi:hypothetical protein